MIATCNTFDPQALWAGERDWFDGAPPPKNLLACHYWFDPDSSLDGGGARRD